ncbi:MAG: polysaccharide deacetylase family protein [Chitinophagales bacterium]|nr:polysaccharide deacetylase family protein [Chitinophagales bacterium]
MYFIKTPEILKRLYPRQVWSLPETEKKLYLTFDDGPTPSITDWTLQTLKDHDAKGTFFIVGQSAERHPEIIKKMKEAGHGIGNHTYKHLNGWSTTTNSYIKDILKCDKIVASKLFRPPYGRITKNQTSIMVKRYKVIMWDVLSGDFDRTISKERCLKNVLENTQSGSIIVFHDSVKAADRMQYALPRVLEYYAKKRFSFSHLSEN